MNAERCQSVSPAAVGISRRGALYAAAVLSVVALSGCGFRLRGSQQLAFRVLRLQGSTATPVAQELRAALVSSGVQVLSATSAAANPSQPRAADAPVVQPDVVLTVLQDQREKAVVGQTAAGQVRELQLRTRFLFSLSTAAGKLLLENTELLLERGISYSETAALAKEAEEALLYRDMQSDIVQQVMRRLAAIKVL
jgi:LPS-assembly lipoprotein